MALRRLYERSIEEFGMRLRRVDRNEWDRKTRCCPDWAIRDLVNHVVSEFRWIRPLLAGKSIEEVGDSLDGDLLGDEPSAAWRGAGAEVLEAISDPEALGRTVHLSMGPTAATDYLAEVLSDQIVHTWDLASSIGYGEMLDPELVEFAARTLEPLAETWRSAGVLGEPIEVADDADRQTKLLALLGRRP